MAYTSYRNNVRSTSIGGWQFGFDARTEWSSVGRTNNNITINGLRTRVRINSGSSGASFSGVEVLAHTDVPSGTRRRNASLGTGTFTRGQSYLGHSGNYSMSVNTNDTSISTRAGVGVNGGTGFGSPLSIPIPALGSPSGNTAINTRTVNSISVRNDVTNWGSNATSGSVRSYRADNSSWSGQTYISTSDNALVNHTGLTSNKRYWFRGWSQNGGGKSSYHGTTSGYTLPLAAVAGTPEFLATSATIPYTQDVGGGAYAITTQYRLKQGDNAYGSWTTVTGGSIELSGLLPNSEYTVELRSTTSAGTTTGGTTSFTTLPAGKLIYPDGTVKNAISRLVKPDGSTPEMVNINLVDPS